MSHKKKKTAKQEAKEFEIIERGTRAVELRKSGASYRAIAARLKDEGHADVTYQTVRRDVKAALAILADDRDDETAELRELQIQRLESQLLAFWVMSLGKAEPEINPDNGQIIIDPNTMSPKMKYTPPSISAGWLVLAIIREISDTLGLKIQKHEHTGKDGAPLFPKVYAGFDPDKV